MIKKKHFLLNCRIVKCIYKETIVKSRINIENKKYIFKFLQYIYIYIYILLQHSKTLKLITEP